MRHIATLSSLLLAAILCLVTATGCSSLEDNRGSTLTTEPGAELNEEMFIGKWDVDGELTNTANGSGGVGAIPSDIWTDMFGDGWRFMSQGVLEVDSGVGEKLGDWKLEKPNILKVKTGEGKDEQRYEVRFLNGYMYMKGADGRTTVMEKEKFFGM